MFYPMASLRIFYAMFSLFTYKAVFWSDRPVGLGTIFALMLLAGSCTAIVTSEIDELQGAVLSVVKFVFGGLSDFMQGGANLWYEKGRGETGKGGWFSDDL